MSVVLETKNRTLEETAVLFDGDEAVETIAGQRANDEKGSINEHSVEK